jgi:hypothetical protein
MCYIYTTLRTGVLPKNINIEIRRSVILSVVLITVKADPLSMGKKTNWGVPEYMV